MATFTTSIQNSIGSSSNSNQTRKRNKHIQIGKEGTKLSLFADDMIVYTENHIDSTRKLLHLISEFGKTMGQKVNIQKSKAFLYTNTEISQAEIRTRIPFDLAIRQIKYLGINLTKEVKDLCSENYTTLKKEIKKDTKTNGSMYHVQGLEELTTSKCLYYPKQFIDSMKTLLKQQ